MRKLVTDRTAVGAFFFVVLGLAVYEASAFSSVARLMPLIIGVPTLVLATAVLGIELFSQWTGKTSENEGALDGSRMNKDLGPEGRRAMARREGGVILWLVGLVALIWLSGLLWTIPLFLLLFLRLQGRESWRLSLTVALGTWAVVYVLFVLILNMELYGGLVQGLWED